MNSDKRWNEADVDAALAGLSVHDASRQRVERIRSRALRTLAARTAPSRLSLALAWRRFEPAGVVAAGAIYMAVVFRMALALYG